MAAKNHLKSVWDEKSFSRQLTARLIVREVSIFDCIGMIQPVYHNDTTYIRLVKAIVVIVSNRQCKVLTEATVSYSFVSFCIIV